MKKISKSVGILLALCLLFTVLPFSVSAEPTDEDGQALSLFSDIKGHWAEDTINRWTNTVSKADFGYVIMGYSDGTFRPNARITRGAATAILERANGYEADGTSDTSFSDVPKNHVFYDYIVACADNKIVHGYDDGTFRPGISITRQSAVAMIARCKMTAADYEKFSDAEQCKTILSEKFTDADKIAPSLYAEICYLNSIGALNGYADKTVRPLQDISRCEFVTLLDGLFNENAEKPDDKPSTDDSGKLKAELSITDGNMIFRKSISGIEDKSNFVTELMTVVKSNRNELNSYFDSADFKQVLNVLCALYDINSQIGWNNDTKSDWSGYVTKTFADANGDKSAVEAFANVDSTFSNLGKGTYVVVNPEYTIILIISAE